MLIHIVSVGSRMPDWVNVGYVEFAKRLSSNCSLNLIEIPLEKRTKNSSISQIRQKEADKIASAIPKGTRIIALDRNGKQISSQALAGQFTNWLQIGQDISFIVGGPDGLAESCLNSADEVWSLSAMTYPHTLVRIILAEQLYRAWSIYNKHPYHR